MKVEKLLKRLKIEFVKVNLIQASLDSIIFFLSTNLVFFMIDQQIIGSVENYTVFMPLTALFFFGDLYYRIKNYHLEVYEEENPELKEVLRTARDNLDRSNIASQALFDDVIDRARSVTSESIIPSREIIKKIIAIGALSFLVVLSGLVNFQIESGANPWIPDEVLPGQNVNQSGDGQELRNSSRILGEPADIRMTKRDLKFNISGTGEAERSEFSFDAASEEFSMTSSPQERPEDMELAKQYSLAIKEFE
jgi:hypothetical protein